MLLSFLIIILSSLLLCTTIGLLSAIIPICFALVIINIELLSLFGAINAQNILIINILTLLVSYYIWIKAGRKIPHADLFGFLKKLKNSFLLDKSLLVLGLCFVFLICVSFLLSYFSPVNEPDAQAYHVFRAIMFSLGGKIYHFDTNEIRNLVMPVNSELIYSWIYTMTRKDTGYSLLSFGFYLFSISSIWGILSYLKFSFRKRLWSVFIYSSLAGIIAQISSTQSDLITGSLVLGGIYYFLISKKNDKILYLSSLCIAIAMGVKSTGVICSIPVIICTCLTLKRDCLKFLAFISVNFIVFSSYNYILNYISFNNPLGSKEVILAHKFWGGAGAFIANYIRHIIQMFDFSGFSWGYYLTPCVLKSFDKLLAIMSIPINAGVNVPLEGLNIFLTEQTMGYGILGWLVFLPSSIYALFCHRKTLKILGALFFINIAILSISVAYMVFNIRFMAAFVAISAPVIALSYFRKMNFYKFLFVLFATFYMLIASTHLSQRPFFKLKKEFGTNNFIEKMRLHDFKFYRSNKDTLQIINFIRSNCPDGSRIAMFLDSSSSVEPYLFLDNYRIEFLNSYHNYNLSKYDFIISSNTQLISAFLKDDKPNLSCVRTDEYAMCPIMIPNYFKKKSCFTPARYEFDKEKPTAYCLFSKTAQSDIMPLR